MTLKEPKIGFDVQFRENFPFSVTATRLRDPDDPVELITVRVTARGATGEPEDRRAERASAGATAALEKRPVWFESDAPVETPVYERAAFRPGNTLVGPAIIEQFDSTTVLHPGDGLRVDDARNLIITVTP